jgi:hypothetical protein
LVFYLKGRTYEIEEDNIRPKSEEVTGRWRKLHNEEFHNLYSSPKIIMVMKSVANAPVTMEQKRSEVIVGRHCCVIMIWVHIGTRMTKTQQ